MSEKKGGLVIQARPQVSVELDEHREIVISVAGIDAAFERCEINEVKFPIECAAAVASALLEIGGKHGAR